MDEVVAGKLLCAVLALVAVVAVLKSRQPRADAAPSHQFDQGKRTVWEYWKLGGYALLVKEEWERDAASRYRWQVWATRFVDLDYCAFNEADYVIAESATTYPTLDAAKRDLLRWGYEKWRLVIRGEEWVRTPTKSETV